MTMPSSVSRARFKGNGTATEFPFAFKVWDVSQLTVTLTDPDDNSSVAAGWTAELAEDGGTVTYLHDGKPLPEGWLLAITRNMPFTQEIDLVSATRFDPAVMEDGLDMATAERQQLREQLSRSVILPPTSDQSPQELADRLLGAEKTAVNAAQKAEMEAATASEQADRAEVEAAAAAAHASDADEAARLARAWAESPTPPDPDAPDSKSAREWAMIAADTVPLATADLPGKACFPPPFTVGENGAVSIREASSRQHGICRLASAEEVAAATAPDNAAVPGNALSLTPQAGKIPVYDAGNRLPARAIPSLLCNTRLVLTESDAAWTPPVTGWARVTVIGGGGGGSIGYKDGYTGAAPYGASSGVVRVEYCFLQKDASYPVVIGAGGSVSEKWNVASGNGGDSQFADIISSGGYGVKGLNIPEAQWDSFFGSAGGLINGDGNYELRCMGGTGGGRGYGRGGNSSSASNKNARMTPPEPGTQGVVIIEYYDPDKEDA